MSNTFKQFAKEGARHLAAHPQSSPDDRRDGKLRLINAASLQTKTFPPIKWLVEDRLPEGLSLLCGKPKLGKSWLALDLACAVAEGGQFLGNLCEQGAALYLALEDNQRRLQDRLKRIRPLVGWPERLDLTCEAPRLSEGGAAAIEEWIASADNPRLIIVDTLATVRPPKNSKESDYQGDYAALRDLHRIAGEHRLAVVVVHHLRKTEGDDPFDMVSGSTGLTGAADATLILTKRTEDGGAVLYGRGRDLQEFEVAVEFDPDHCRWKVLGDPSVVFLSDTRLELAKAMKAGKQTPGAIATVTGLSETNVTQTLRRMVRDGQALKEARGCYVLTEALSERVSEVSDCQDSTGETDNLTDLTTPEAGE
ncbi:MAG: AAA family ATPase [Paracoccaceae bacterium]|nr:AAA family ATPase [Paracoccaceae bacterium]